MVTTSTALPSEAIMQYIWRHHLWSAAPMTSMQGQRIRIIDQGVWNRSQGPDFLEARVMIDGQEWAGNIEMHVRASDWHKHGHDGNPEYDNVILHVVAKDDARITQPDGSEIPQLVMHVDPGFAELGRTLLKEESRIMPYCQGQPLKLHPVYIESCLGSLAMARLQRKCGDINRYMESHEDNWSQASFMIFARALGFGTNGDTMEQLAGSLNIHILERYRDVPEFIQAMLFGQACMLDNPVDDFHKYLARQYDHFKRRYNLTPLKNPLWRHSSRIPANTPARRIAMLASMVAEELFEYGMGLSKVDDVNILYALLNVPMTKYWDRHYTFGCPSTTDLPQYSRGTAARIIINAFIPLIYHYGVTMGEISRCETAVELLESMESESNAIIQGFKKAGFKPRSAFIGQGMIQLHKEYCQKRRCIECQLGHKILAQKVAFITPCAPFTTVPPAH